MRVQKRYARIIWYVGKDGRGDYFDVKLLSMRYFVQEICRLVINVSIIGGLR